MVVDGEVGLVSCSLKDIEDWVILGGGVDIVREDYAGGSALYSYGGWLVILAGWSLFVSIFIVIEITRGR